MAYQQQYGYAVPLMGTSPQPPPLLLQASPGANIVQLPPQHHSPGHMASPLPAQGGGYYYAAPQTAYYPNTPIVPAGGLPQVHYAPIQTAPTQPTAHYALAANNNPLVMWDVFQPTSTIRATNPSYPIYLHVPAVEPAVSSLRLVCKDMPWLITIKKKEGAVTVGDVFEAIFLQLQEPIIHSEWRLMGSSMQKKATQRFGQRMDLQKSLGQADDGRGIRRVDYLLSRTAFVGIRQDDKAINELVGDIDLTNAWLLVLGERR